MLLRSDPPPQPRSRRPTLFAVAALYAAVGVSTALAGPPPPLPSNPTAADLVARLKAARNGVKLAAVKTVR